MPQRHADGPKVTSSPQALTFRLSATAAIEFSRRGDRGYVALKFGSAGIGPDVSRQPAAVMAVLEDQAQLVGHDPNRWRIELLRALRVWHPELSWCALEPRVLTAAIGAFTHPLLGEIYRQGVEPLGEIPRWASAVLRSADASTAAQQLAGAATNRRLTRSLAQSLPPPRIASISVLWPSASPVQDSCPLMNCPMSWKPQAPGERLQRIRVSIRSGRSEWDWRPTLIGGEPPCSWTLAAITTRSALPQR